METCVLIPKEFSLALTASSKTNHINNICKSEAQRVVKTMRISVWTNEFIPARTLINPFQGSIRFDKIHLYSLLDDNDIRREYGCYDEVSYTSYSYNKRQCNWIRFLRIVKIYNEKVNLIGTKIKGEPVFEVIKDIQPDAELLAWFLPISKEDVYFLTTKFPFQSIIHQYIIDSILDDDLKPMMGIRGLTPKENFQENYL